MILVKSNGERGIDRKDQLGVSFSPVSDGGVDASAEDGRENSLYAGDVDWGRRSSLVHGHGVVQGYCFTCTGLSSQKGSRD
jgi:hypothetical protein